jgi:hypothetical protein
MASGKARKEVEAERLISAARTTRKMQLAGARKCPSCQKPVQPHYHFCTGCGQDVKGLTRGESNP